MIGQQLIKQNNPSDHVWVGSKERVRVRVRVISVRVRDHILPVMGEHEGLAGVLHAQQTVHLLHRVWCASTGGATTVCVCCTRTAVQQEDAATPGFLKLFQVLYKCVS